MLTPEELESSLNHFSGTEQYHRYNLFGRELLLTDGVEFLVKNAECCWLLDLILSVQFMPAIKKLDMQFWTLNVNLEKRTAEAICERDSNDVVYRQPIPFTSFPLAEQKIWISDGVALLPGEY